MGKCSKRLIIPIFLLCSGSLAFGLEVRGTEGQAIILPCRYKVRGPSDITTMCWGRGSCPNSKCNQRLIETDGHKVTFSSSNLYQLREDIANGQVSLTIVNVGLEHQGTYCCRIEHSGWFNDEKINIQLKVDKAPPTTRPTTTRPTNKPTTRPTTKPATRPKVEPTTRPTAKPATRPKVEPTTRPTTKPAIRPKVEPTTRPTTKPESQPKAEPTTQQTTKPAAQPKAEQTQPTTQEHILNTTKDTTTPFYSILITDTGYTDHGQDNLTTESWKPDDGKESTSSGIYFEMTSVQSSISTSYSALASGNVTAQKTVGSGTTPYVLITIITVSIILLVVFSLVLLKLRGKESGRYLLHMDPSLELVANGEDQINEKKFSFAGAENTDARKIMVDEDDLNTLASKKAEWEGRTGPTESETEIKNTNGDLKPCK